MHAPSATELLNIWEQGQARPVAWRALLLLTLARPDADIEDLARLSIGQRDACLLALREQLYGPDLTGTLVCPACGASLDISFDIAEVRALPVAAPAGPLEVQVDGFIVQFRLPTSLDLIAVVDCTDIDTTRDRLLERCLVSVAYADTQAPASQLSAPVVATISACMARADPQANAQLAIDCSQCGHTWQALFDIGVFLWSEIHVWARRILREVHILARAYGWRERDILALSPWRRQVYLEMVEG